MSDEKNLLYGLPPVPKRTDYSDIPHDSLAFALFRTVISDAQNPDRAFAVEDDIDDAIKAFNDDKEPR
jgi:hypothetical protein